MLLFIGLASELSGPVIRPFTGAKTEPNSRSQVQPVYDNLDNATDDRGSSAGTRLMEFRMNDFL